MAELFGDRIDFCHSCKVFDLISPDSWSWHGNEDGIWYSRNNHNPWVSGHPQCVCVGKTHNSNGAQLLWQVLITCDRHPLTFPLSGPKRKLLLGHPSSRLGHFQNVCPHIRAIVCSTSLRVSDTQTHWSQFHFLPTSAIKKSSKCWLIS